MADEAYFGAVVQFYDTHPINENQILGAHVASSLKQPQRNPQKRSDNLSTSDFPGTKRGARSSLV